MSAAFPSLKDAVRRAADWRRARPALLLFGSGAVLVLLIFSLFGTRAEKPGEFVVRRGTLEPTVPLVGTLAPARPARDIDAHQIMLEATGA